MKSPYYDDSHRKFRKRVRAFVEKEIKPFVHEWDEAKTYPPELHTKAYEAGVLGAMWPVEYGGTPPEGCDGKPNPFHDLILWDELARSGSGGILAAVFVSMSIALPPVLSVGSDYIKDKVARDVITGKKIICLAITEPYAGSDVSALKCSARQEGDFYYITGEKKFITSGVKADYFVVCARTGDQGMFGLSLFLLEKGMPGLKARRQKTMGWWCSNTAYLTFNNVKVPAKNMIGAENAGFLPIMYQFNHERFLGMVAVNRGSRVCLEEAIKFARKRKTFGKRLIDHQVIRHKIAEMARLVETTHAVIEQYAYQMQTGASENRLGIMSALIKVQATKTMEFCAREAAQIFGGASYLRGGVADKVERLYREVRVNAIGGGSEEIMLDFAMRQSKL